MNACHTFQSFIGKHVWKADIIFLHLTITWFIELVNYMTSPQINISLQLQWDNV